LNRSYRREAPRYLVYTVKKREYFMLPEGAALGKSFRGINVPRSA